MYLSGLLCCVLIVIAAGSAVPKRVKELPDLNWPAKYTLEAEKISLISGLVENIQYWRTKTKSRVDYNNDAVKIVTVKPKMRGKYLFGVKYEVHPETTEDFLNYLVCSKIVGNISSVAELDDILPSVYNFDHVGSEIVEENTVEVFRSLEKDESTDLRETLRATYTNEIWIPISYERIEYNTWLYSKKKHEIWKFRNFETTFNSSDVFEVEDSYDCKTKTNSAELDESQSKKISADNDYHVNRVFKSFKKEHNKVYMDEMEHSLRKKLFQERMRLVIENNKKNTGFKLTINKLADRTPEELKSYLGLMRPSQRESDTHAFPYSNKKLKKMARTLPDEFDLRDLGIITPVKAQEECGACWAFATTSAIEGALALKNGGRLLRLSTQALIDCAWGFGPSGCDGGFDTAAYRWMMKYGLPTEEEYGQYENHDDFCRIDNMTTIYPIRGFTNVTPLSVRALKATLLNIGPVSTSMHVTATLYLYEGGIYYDPECDSHNLNHEVTVVGYGKQNGEEYWIIKNSWGQNWGIDGYFYISTRDNNCGITSEPSYPVI